MQYLRPRNVINNAELYYSLGTSVRVDLKTQLGAAFDPLPTTGLAVDLVREMDMRYYELPQEQRDIIEEQISPLRQRQNELAQELERNARAGRLSPNYREESLNISRQINEIYQSAINEQIELGNLRTPEELNEQYSEYGYDFLEPMGQERVDLIIDRIRERRLREGIMQVGPKGILPTVATLGTTLASYIVDPIELGSAFVPVVGQAKYAQYIRRLGKYRGRIVAGAQEGTVGAILTEPLYRTLSDVHQIDVSMTDSLFNIGIGTILGGGFGMIRGRLSSRTADSIEADIRNRTQRRGGKYAKDLIEEEGRLSFSMGLITGKVDLPDIDVRGKLPIFEFRGTKYQGINDLPEQIKKDLQVGIYQTDNKGNIKIYKRQANAERYAGENGTVVKTDEGFVIVDYLPGEVAKKENGDVLVFDTPEQAQALVNNDPNFYDVELKRSNAQVIPIATPEGKKYGVAIDMADEDAIKFANIDKPQNIILPKGIDARRRTVLAKADGGIKDLVYGKNAQKLINQRVFDAINKRVEHPDDIAFINREASRGDELLDVDKSIEEIEARIEKIAETEDAPILKIKDEIDSVINEKQKFADAIGDVIDDLIEKISRGGADKEKALESASNIYKKLTKAERRPAQIKQIHDRLVNIVRERVVDTDAPLSNDMIEVLIQEGNLIREAEILNFKQQKRQHLLQMLAYESLFNRAKIAKEITGDSSLGLESALTGSSKLYEGAGIGVDQRTKGYQNMFLAKFIKDLEDENILDLFKKMNKQDERILSNTIELINRDSPTPRELLPDVSDNIYKLAKIISKFNNEFRIRKNNAGAAIRNLQGYITRQTHNKSYIIRNKDEWISTLKKSLDFDSMDVARNDIDDFLEAVYKNITAETKVSKSRNAGNGLYELPNMPSNVANRLQRERMLKFKTGSDWYDYNQKFGKIKSVRESFIHDMESTSRSISLMEIWGPNPGYILERLKTDLFEIFGDEANLFRTSPLRIKLETLLDEVTGYNNVAESEGLAKAGKFIRGLNTIAKLGGAALASISDIFTIAGQQMSMGAGFFSSINRAFKSLYLGRVARRNQKEYAEFLSIGLDSFLGSFTSRINATDTFDGTSARLMQNYFKLNLLSPWTENAKIGVSMMIARDIAKQSNRSWNQVNLDLRRILEQYNINKNNWDIVRRAVDTYPDGKKYISPSKFDDLNLNPKQAEELKLNLITLLDTEADIAVPTPGAYEQAIIKGGYRPGHPLGEAVRAIMQFKAFPLTIHTKVLARQKSAYGQTGQWKDINTRGMLGIAQLASGMTLMGMTAIQMKELARGREPREINVDLLTRGFVQGGASGLIGDFIFSEASRYGEDPLISQLGPTAGQARDLLEIYNGTRDIMFGGETSRSANNMNLIRFARNNTPLVNLFYTREVMNYLVWYQLQEAVNPGYLRRTERLIEKEGQEYIIKPSDHVRYGGGGFK
jgi:hypothetical protein